MTYQEVLDQIDFVIYENDNEEITADLTNQLLKDITAYVNVVPTGVILIDPVNGDDAKASFDKRFPFKSVLKAVKFAQAGNLIVFYPGDYIYEKGNWAKQGVYYHFMQGARVIIKDAGDRPFSFEWGGLIMITGFMQMYGKEGYNGSVNAIPFPINIYNQKVEPATVYLEIDELIAHFGGLNIRGNIERSFFKAQRVGGMVDNSGFQHIVNFGKHFFEVEHLDVPDKNLWGGTNGYYFRSNDNSKECLINGRIKELTIKNGTSLWSAGVGTNYGDSGNCQSTKKVNIKIDRMMVDSKGDNIAFGYYQQRYAGTADIEIKEVVCKNKGIAAMLNDGYYFNSFTRLKIDSFKAENRAIKSVVYYDSKHHIHIANGYQKSNIPSNMIEISRPVDNAGLVRLSGQIKNDNGNGVSIAKPIKAMDIDQMIIECTGDYSIICDAPDQKLRLLNYISTNKPFKNIINTVATATIYDL